MKRARVDAYPPDTPTYDRDDLEMFKMVLDSAYGEICRKGKLAEVGSGPETVVSLARAIFFHADQGERNPVRLKRLVIETVAQAKDIGPGRANVTPLFQADDDRAPVGTNHWRGSQRGITRGIAPRPRG